MGILPLPQIQIHQQYGRIGIDADMGQLEIQQPRATLEIRTTPSRLEIDAEPGMLLIDNTRWHDALGFGPSLDVMSRIYSKASNIALQAISKIVEEGNRMAAIQTGENVIKSLAKESVNEEIVIFKGTVVGEASLDNIDINYEPGKFDRHFEAAKVERNVTVHAPIIEYQRGKLDIYMLQQPKLEITPPQIDLKF
ncbi:DUF6470 family protein [Paenibacillus qinlingensis]|uniref:DUF2345 domain-containing protein n=1 Tax=Paenibacillus qinlingensis TaxID=1837343 RepID=A0ABU1P319_9BACL|nr:DUF6470 family protein [Paenibacillus qinlingensis]MDR6553607.1 hypothetical protein [Paenibacillus qinlingensis]